MALLARLALVISRPADRKIGRPADAKTVELGIGGENLRQPKYYAAAGRPKSIWMVPGSRHTGGINARPVEYERRVVAFFDRAFATHNHKEKNLTMIDFTIETEIARPVSAVFAYVTDPSKLATWQTSTVSATQEDTGPLGLGTPLREVHRAPGGTELASRVEVSEYEPDRTFALHMLEGALPLDARITFEPTGQGTQIRFRTHGQATGAMRLAQPLLRRSLKRQFARDCATLKHVLESTPPDLQ